MKKKENDRLYYPEGEFTTRTEKGHDWVDFRVSNFPGQLWLEWEQDCKTRYNDVRWLKMLCDHLEAQDKSKERDDLVQEVLERITKEFEQDKKDEKEYQAEEIPTLGGKVK